MNSTAAKNNLFFLKDLGPACENGRPKGALIYRKAREKDVKAMTHTPRDAKSIFLDAIEKHSPEQWGAYLDVVCGDDAQLRTRAEELLKAHADLGNLPSRVVVADPAPTIDQPITEKPGTVIDRYKLLEQIGEGGFGVVFMAEQEEPVRRKVALKIIKPGMDTKEVIARFEAERQALAIMDHPNIAKVLDAGATESGRPFFVMELVRGIPITDFCDQYSLSTRERLELFRSVCQAVQHAHQKGIIHRDIKPSNVMVTLRDDTPVPKVIDFGVAKATNARLTDRTLFTRFGQMIGTPLYMSPEQAGISELDIDTRSDIYSLGVLLYELLTGTTPFDRQRIREAAYDELLKIIREEEPPKPSLRISTLGDTLPSVAAHRKLEPKKLSALVRGELDWIVMKALEKDRTRRYETASALAADMQRYLDNEAVEACPPSAAYRFRKWAKRHKTAVTLITATVLLSGLLLTGLRVSRNQRLAELRTAGQEAVTAAELSLAHGQYDLTVGRLIEARSRLADAPKSLLPMMQQIDDLLAKAEDQRQVRQFRHLANEARAYAYFDRDLRKARVVCEEALDSYNVASATVAGRSNRAAPAEELPGELRGDAFELLLILARAQFYAAPDKNEQTQAARLERALETLGQAGRLRRRGPAVYLYRAEFLKRSGEEAAAKAEEERAAKAEPQTALDHFLLGRRAGRVDGITHYKAALRVQPDHVPSLLHLGHLYRLGEHPEPAEVCYTACLALLPDDDIHSTRAAYVFRGLVYQDLLDDLALALADFTAARDIDPERWSPHSFRGLANHELKNYQDAVADFTTALELIEGHESFNKAYAAEVYFNRGDTYRELGDFKAATADFFRAGQLWPLRIGDEVVGLFFEGPPELHNPAKAMAVLGMIVAAHRIQLAESPESKPLRNALANDLHSLGHLLEISGRLDEAEQAFDEFLTIYKNLAAESPDEAIYQENSARGYSRLITVLQKNRRWTEAGTFLGEARKLDYSDPDWTYYLAWWLATWPDEKLRDPREAIRLAEEAIEAQPENPGHWSNLGTAHYRAGNWQEAITALEKYNEHVHDAFFLAMAHWQMGDKDQARNYFDQAVERMQEDHADDEELARFRAEAETLLEIQEPSTPKRKKSLTPRRNE